MIHPHKFEKKKKKTSVKEQSDHLIKLQLCFFEILAFEQNPTRRIKNQVTVI